MESVGSERTRSNKISPMRLHNNHSTILPSIEGNASLKHLNSSVEAYLSGQDDAIQNMRLKKAATHSSVPKNMHLRDAVKLSKEIKSNN